MRDDVAEMILCWIIVLLVAGFILSKVEDFCCNPF